MGTKRRRRNRVDQNGSPRIESLESRRLMAVFTVTNTGDSGPGSLRAAIEQSNNTPGIDTIAFNIASADKTIRVNSGLPSIYDAAIVDGTTQPGYAGQPLIRIDGSAAGGAPDGIDLYGGCTLAGLCITGFGGQGVAALPRNAGGNLIRGNWIGVDLNGNAAGNHNHGIAIYTPGNTVDHNVVSCSAAGEGIFILGGIFGGSNGNNTLRYNLVGTDPTGTAARGNGLNGIAIGNSLGNIVLNNVVAASAADGLLLFGPGTTGTIVRGNIVGLNGSGSAPLSNLLYGIEISGPNNVIGGTSPGDGNIVSANSSAGIVFYTADAHGNLAQGNFVGTDSTGTRALGNHEQGIAFASAGPNQIGGDLTGAGNLIAGNLRGGIGVFPGNGEVIVGNTLGLDVNGSSLPNLTGNIYVSGDSQGTVIGINTGPAPTPVPPITAGSPTAIPPVSTPPTSTPPVRHRHHRTAAHHTRTRTRGG